MTAPARPLPRGARRSSSLDRRVGAAVRARPGCSHVDRYFKVEWDPEAVPRGGWAVQGHVSSTHPYRVNGVRLQVDVLDSAGGVENSVYGWVPGDVPSGGRAYFFVSVPRRGASYRVKVLVVLPGLSRSAVTIAGSKESRD